MKKILLTLSQIVLGFLVLYFLRNIFFNVQRLTNFYLVGSRNSVHLIDDCKLNNDITVRAYVAYGSSVTTSDSNSVYVQVGQYPFERPIWSAYSSPSIEEMNCEEGNLIINTGYYIPEYALYKFSAEQITTNLINNPIRIYKGRYLTEEEIGYQKDGEIFFYIAIAINLILAFIASLLVFKYLPSSLHNRIKKT